MSDSAAGALTGFLYQFEKALAMLATLGAPHETVSVEMVDDVAVQSPDDVVLMALQAKHSISPNGTTFEDTSYALWRTIQLWIEKLANGTFNDQTAFICSTNKIIPAGSLLRRIKDNDIDEVVREIKELLTTQEEKLKALKQVDPKSGGSIQKVSTLIKYALSNEVQFAQVKANLQIQDNEDLQEKFFVALHMTSNEYTPARKQATFESMYGWIAARSKARWKNGADARFQKIDFDSRLAQVNSNPAIISAIFRKKSWLGSLDAKMTTDAKKELFVRQIEDINRNERAKERKIERAIQDFLYHDIEVAHIIKSGNLTDVDFEEFRKNCKERWQACYDAVVIKELDEYEDESKNEMAVRIFDEIMDKVVVSFQSGIAFTQDNQYIHNGTFLKLSNIPEIGWHPEWENKYRGI